MKITEEVKQFADYVCSKIACHNNYHGDDIVSAIYAATEGKDIGNIKYLEVEYKNESNK